MDFEPGVEIDQYRIVRPLGRGGMGAVYEVENVKPLLYYGLGWSETPCGEFVVEPGMWIQADENGNLPGEVKAPRGKGSSRFFRVKVTDDPMVTK